MTAVIVDLPIPSLSRLIAAQEMAGAGSARGIADAAAQLRGQVPDADLILAAVRCYNTHARAPELAALLDQLDEMLVD